jgi:hypothetical protein
MNDLKVNTLSGHFINPLLLNYTPKTSIREENNSFFPPYDDEKQIIYDMRSVRTTCRKTTSKNLPGGSQKCDCKNEVDDHKNVK